MEEKSGHVLLVVEDRPLAAELEVILTGVGHTISIAQNTQSALEIITSGSIPNVILLDADLPGLADHSVCESLKKDPKTSDIPVILIMALPSKKQAQAGMEKGAADFMGKPLHEAVVIARVRTHMALADLSRRLEELVVERTLQLESTQVALREAMQNLLTTQVAPGVFWVQIPEVSIYILCGSPGEVVKHLMRQGYIKNIIRDGVSFESGPNVILLSDLSVQNGGFANLAEFPVLQMLYRQGMIIPGHPNNTGQKPMLLGSEEQIHAQLEYIHRGNYGLISKEELMECGIDEEKADVLMRIKRNFAFGRIQQPSEFLDTLEVLDTPQEIRSGVSVKRTGLNQFCFEFRGQSTHVNLNLPANVAYERPYPLDNHRFNRQYFAVLHTGDGDGWDINRSSMGSVIMYQGRIFLIDAGPGIMQALTALGIDISEVEGIFHTHCHDDHFGGLPALVHSDHRLKYYATPCVRASVVKKLSALMSLGVGEFERFFDICDLEADAWNNCNGLEVMPIYSPHPVETNIYLFRALDKDKYRYYAHWADLTSFTVLDGMMKEGPDQISKEFIDKVKSDYLVPVDLKKLDIGGGMIHGMAEDFRQDKSDRLILAHIARELTMEEKEIGSESSFGALDVLIKGEQDFRRKRAYDYLRLLFPNIDKDKFQILLNSPIVELNAGTIIRRAKERSQYIDMVLSGTIVYINHKRNIHNNLSFGSFIGDRHLLTRQVEKEGTYRAVSHCTVMRISNSMMRTFLETNQLFDEMKEVTSKVWSLRKTWLFGGQTSFLSLRNILGDLKQASFEDNEAINPELGEAIWLVEKGAVNWTDEEGNLILHLKTGDFFGEHSYTMENGSADFRFRTQGKTKLFCISIKPLMEIPVIYWKLIETISKRQTMLLSHSS